MFIPNANAAAEAAAIKQACARVEQLALELVPDDIRSACQINVSEVQCGDPQCAPIDTTVLIFFERYVLTVSECVGEVLDCTYNRVRACFPPILEPYSYSFTDVDFLQHSSIDTCYPISR